MHVFSSLENSWQRGETLMAQLNFSRIDYSVCEGEDFGDLKVVKDPQDKVFILIQKRGILIPVKTEELNFHITCGKAFIHGVPFTIERSEKIGDDISVKRNNLTSSYKKRVTVILFLNSNSTELVEALCPQFG